MSSERLRRIEKLYNSALDLEPGQRAGYLVGECGTDEELRREVESLLRNGETLEQPAFEVAAEGYVSEVTANLKGRELGPYMVLSRLGAGGMGVVYRARDSRLNRIVALKVLPAEMIRDPERKRRLIREAQAASALNHPNIVTVHDVGSDGDIDYIVMEYLEGETLAERLKRGPLPLDQVLRYGIEIADALERAHRHRIVHRDLKPGNIMLTKSGAKVLDFGLAKIRVSETPGGTTLPANPLTEEGVILGTPQYMAPEQLEGKEADARTDIFAFGAVLYEMATGRKAFEGKSRASVIAAILRSDPPPISTLQPLAPPKLDHIVRTCLAKDPAERRQTAHDVMLELKWLADGSQAGVPASTVSRRTNRERLAWTLVAAISTLLLLTASAAGLYVASPKVLDQAAYRFMPFAFEPGGQLGGVWSPDGRAVAYAARGGGDNYQVFVRYLDSPVPAQVTRISEDAYPLAWTPDGQRILFKTERKLAGVWSVAAAGGEPESIYARDGNKDVTYAVSPDLRAIAVRHRADDGRFGVWISAPPGSPLKKYSPDPFATRDVHNGCSLGFSPDGKCVLLFFGSEHAEEGWLLPYPPDPSRPPHRILENLPAWADTPTFSWMPDSRRIVVSIPFSFGSSSQLWMADTLTGEYRALTSGTTARKWPSVSPDGRKVVFTDTIDDFDIVSASLETAAVHPLIATERSEFMPAWAARQAALVYVTDRNGPLEVWLRSGGADRPLVTPRDFPPDTTDGFMGPALSPDALRVIYTLIPNEQGVCRLWISAASGGAPSRLTNNSSSASQEFPGSWSPDGNWFAYLRVENAKASLMKAKTTGQATPVLLRGDLDFTGDGSPAWSPAGDWISVQDQLISPDGKTTRPLGNKGSEHYMFSADGKRVYGIRADGGRELLFYIDIATGREKVVGDLGKDFRPHSSLNPSIRFSLGPDGKSFVYGVSKTKRNLWLLEGFEMKSGLFARLGLR